MRVELTPQEKLALEDVRRNDGVMWEPELGHEAQRLWDALIRKGAVTLNPWTGKYAPTSLHEDSTQ